jgi:hypothetical protein
MYFLRQKGKERKKKTSTNAKPPFSLCNELNKEKEDMTMFSTTRKKVRFDYREAPHTPSRRHGGLPSICM